MSERQRNKRSAKAQNASSIKSKRLDSVDLSAVSEGGAASQASARAWQKGSITVEPSPPPLELVLENQKLVIFIPDMRELHSGKLGDGLGPAMLRKIVEAGGRLLSKTPVESHPKITRLMRALLERCETSEPNSLPPGDTGLAFAALETVANAIACWQHGVRGKPLFAHSGRAFYSTGSPTKRSAKYLGAIEHKVQTAPTLFIALECGVSLRAPRWFLEARELQFPVEPKAVELCKPLASLALRDYLASMVGENRLEWMYGEPIGGQTVRASLSWTPEGNRRVKGDLSTERPNAVVERVHKKADSALRKITSLIPGRLPFGYWCGPNDL